MTSPASVKTGHGKKATSMLSLSERCIQRLKNADAGQIDSSDSDVELVDVEEPRAASDLGFTEAGSLEETAAADAAAAADL